MTNEPKKRTLGEMISTVSFYGVGVYFILDGSLLRDEGAPLWQYAGMWFAGMMCLAGGARFLIGDLVAKTKKLLR